MRREAGLTTGLMRSFFRVVPRSANLTRVDARTVRSPLGTPHRADRSKTGEAAAIPPS